MNKPSWESWFDKHETEYYEDFFAESDIGMIVDWLMVCADRAEESHKPMTIASRDDVYCMFALDHRDAYEAYLHRIWEDMEPEYEDR